MTSVAKMQPACDAALDYLYSMLDGEDKARFEEHLKTCARCQAELEAFGRVRIVAQSALPTVEPGERLTGALHAQLMHAAATRPVKKKPLLRRVLSHPAYAAAASIVLIGGAVGLQLSRGHLMMPAKEAAAPVVTAPAPVAATTPAAEPTDEKKDEQTVVKAKLAGVGTKGKGADAFDGLDLPDAKDSSSSDRRAHAALKPAPRLDLDGSGSLSRSAGPIGRAGDGYNQPAASARAQAVAPPPAAPATTAAPAYKKAIEQSSLREEAAPAEREVARDKVNDAVPQPLAPVKAGKADYDSANMGASTDDAPGYGRQNASANVDPIDADRQRALSLVQAGRCDEAATAFESIDRRAPDRLGTQDRLKYEHCLRVLGRLQPAQQELDQLRAKNAAPAAVSLEQNALDGERKRQTMKKPAKAKAAPADANKY